MSPDAPAREVSFTLNGAPFTARVDDGTSLLEVLRDQAGLLSPKNGCAPQGSCGACTVLIDGRARASCAVPAARVEGRRVLTLEGFGARERHVFAHAFASAGAVQCGYCLPGIVVAAKRLIEEVPRPTRRQIAEALNSHVCRCTGYVKIVDAIDLAARALQGEALPALDESGRIGTSLPKQDAARFVLGEHRYVDDIRAEGLLHAAFLFSEHPRARVVRIDTSAARASPGVARVVTAADVPGDRWQGLLERDWPLFVAEGETTHCLGDILAAAVADSARHAREAVRRVLVEYEVLPGVFSPEAALAPGAPRVHPDRSNLLSRSSITRGRVDAAFAASAHVETRTFTTQVIEHAFLEPESCVAMPGDWGSGTGDRDDEHGSSSVVPISGPRPPASDPRITVYSQGQGVFDDRRQIASSLGLPESSVHVIQVPTGGAFGGKEDLSIQAQVALMALLTGRPVKATLTREESIRLHPKRHPMTLTYTVGCGRDGRLTALRARIVGDTGAFASVGAKVLERAAGHAAGPYRVPAVDIESAAVYTNNPPCGAMRGFGANQAAFAIESMLDILAERAGLDGWEMRWRNALDRGDTFCTGQVLDCSVGLKETLLAVKGVYYSSPRAGIACGIKNVGIGNGAAEAGQAVVEVTDRGRVVIHTGFTEMGQGFHTAMVQCLCDITGIDPALVRTEVDTAFPTPCGMTTASRATVLGGRAVQEAARRLKADLAPGVLLLDLAGRRYYGQHQAGETMPLGANAARPRTHMTYGFATQVCLLDPEGRLQTVVAAHDVGRIINRRLLEGQIEGAVHMGLGYALTEELALTEGVPDSFRMQSLGLIRARAMPEVRVVLVESCDPEGPFGAKGVGEIGLVPTAGAVANALCRFDGVRRYALPMRDSAAARHMRGHGG
ncbi:MAG TPA: molybdopterin-dependent oxidoreductase [Vicinamibacterales bacterium]|nr:molybdopterin-dependent oxidoreductase [Vicinamibacterales bacterium]HPW20479.1 molybdopterin-dependent oxidoreductase [Vicinamibacterales bacterium]